jgi:hypothetical protein
MFKKVQYWCHASKYQFIGHSACSSFCGLISASLLGPCADLGVLAGKKDWMPYMLVSTLTFESGIALLVNGTFDSMNKIKGL